MTQGLGEPAWKDTEEKNMGAFGPPYSLFFPASSSPPGAPPLGSALGELHPEAAPLVLFRNYAHLTPHPDHGPAYDGEADASSLPLNLSFQPLEYLEDPRNRPVLPGGVVVDA